MRTKDFNSFVDQNADALYRYILKHTRDEGLAADIVQEAFEVLWRNRKKIAKEKKRSYLFATAHNLVVDAIRKEQKKVEWEDVREDAFYYTPDYKGLMEFLEPLLDELPIVQKSVLLLRDYEGYPYKDIGEITGLTQSQVKVYIHRARKFLKNYIVKIDNIL